MSTKVKYSLAVILGGGISNCVDKIWNGEVINFIKIGRLPSVNIAYILYIIGWISFLIFMVKNTLNIKADLKLEDCISENERAEKNIEQLESDNFNAEEILYGVEDLKKHIGYSENGKCFFAKLDTTTGTVVECLDRDVRKVDFSEGLNGMKVNAIGKYAFAGCSNLIGIELGTDVTSIGINAFSGSGLTEDFVIPPYVTSVESGAFNDIDS